LSRVKQRWRSLILGSVILLAAAAVRLPALTAGLPYLGYVDEGHVLHPVVHLLAAKTWEPAQYAYPSLPLYLIAASAAAYSPVYAAVHGRALRGDLSPFPPAYYDVVEPAELIVLGRLVTLAFSLGVVVLTGLLAARLAGPAAGLFAAWLAALLPALVARGVPITVAPFVACFTLAALLFAERTREGGRPRRDAVLAGILTGLAAAAKYPAVLVCLPVALAVLLSRASWLERFRRLVLAGAAAAAAALAATPALALRLGDVLRDVRANLIFYRMQDMGSYWDQAVHRAEWDLPLESPELGIVFLILAAAGLIVALRDRRWRKDVWGWLIFGAATGLLFAPYKFRAFRNLVALVPLACVLVALLYAGLRRALRRPLAADLAAAVLPVLLFVPSLVPYIRFELRLADSREQAIHWLAGHAGPRDRVLFAEELAILPHRIAALKVGGTAVEPWPVAKHRLRTRRFHYLVLGDLKGLHGGAKIGPLAQDWILRNYTLAKAFGLYPTSAPKAVYRGNGQRIYILKRVPRPREDEAAEIAGR
jgi:hypothetical protein